MRWTAETGASLDGEVLGWACNQSVASEDGRHYLIFCVYLLLVSVHLTVTSLGTIRYDRLLKVEETQTAQGPQRLDESLCYFQQMRPVCFEKKESQIMLTLLTTDEYWTFREIWQK